jgi:hypothetical protein
MSERRKKEQEKERAMMEAARAERVAKRSELWKSIDSFAPSQTQKVVPARLQAAGAQIDAFESIEVPVQEQRESAILEVFVSREGEGGPADPADFFFGHEEGQGGGAAKFIPLYSTKDFQVTARPMLRDIIMDDERSGEFESANLAAGPVPEDAVAVARGMLNYMNEDQKRELRTLFPADLPTSSTLRFDQFWASAEEIAVESIQDELPAAFQDLPPAVITWLANNPDVVVELIDNDTGEIDPEKLKITVEGLYANNLVPRPTMQMQAVAPPMSAVPVLSALPLPNSGAMGGPAPAQDPHALYAERMRQLNNMGRGRGMGAPMGVGPPPMGMPPNMQQQPQSQMGVMGANGSVNGVPADNLIAAVTVEFKRGRKERFRVDDPVLAAQCAGFNGPYHMWIECNSNGNPGKDVGQVIEQMGRNRAGDTFQMRRALSVATPDDVAGFTAKHQAELEALQMAQNLARDMGLPMTIDDAEWQFDKKKLTMFYSAGGRVDFRDFVKKMGSHNKTFLWMVRSDGKAPPNNLTMHQSRPGAAPGGMPGGMMGMGGMPMGGGGMMAMGRGMPMGAPMGGGPPMGMGMGMPMQMQRPGQQMGTM